VNALEYGQTCLNSSTNNECKYLTEGTSCLGPAPFECQCQIGKYYNCKNRKCETTASSSTSSTTTKLSK
jgi:hypothetical protein